MTDELAAIEEWVRAELESSSQEGLCDISDVRTHPSAAVAASVLETRVAGAVGPTRSLAFTDLESGATVVVDVDLESVAAPEWSPDGTRLVVLGTVNGVTTARVLDTSAIQVGLAPSKPTVLETFPEVQGHVESARWSADGGRLVCVVAQFGAEVSDVHGSGNLKDPSVSAPWRPRVSPSPRSGRRVLHMWDPTQKVSTTLAPHLNAWEASWCGPDTVVVLASDEPGEGAWYAATLYTIGTIGTTGPGTINLVPQGRHQLAQPSGSPSGHRWSVLSGPASDRGLLAGTILVGDADGVTMLNGAGADVTDHLWVAEDLILFAGTRTQETIYGVIDVSSGATRLFHSHGLTSGIHQPTLGGITPAGDLVAALESHDNPPSLTVLSADGQSRRPPKVILSSAGPGSEHLVASCGSTRAIEWTSSDGTRITGLLTVPSKTEGSLPLIVNIHGGPVAAWHDGWLGRDRYTHVLVARGFAVLRPNPRGSSGRGAAFVEAVIGDMGGDDTHDVLTGVEHLIASDIATPGRTGVTGNSYGGFMAAWLPCLTSTFAAAVSRSPVTDWRSQHLTSNLREFDELFVGGDPFDPGSHYATRSPLLAHKQINTPMMLTAGANDLATPASQALQLHAALLRTGVATHLAIYPEEGHGVRGPDALIDQLARMVWWFETHL